jgi:hypothetical protein
VVLAWNHIRDVAGQHHLQIGVALETLPNYDTWKTSPPSTPEIETEVNLTVNLNLMATIENWRGCSDPEDAVETWASNELAKEIKNRLTLVLDFISVENVKVDEIVGITVKE